VFKIRLTPRAVKRADNAISTQSLVSEDAMANTRTKPFSEIGSGQNMGLSAPSLLTFLLSFVIMLSVLFAKFFGATSPGLTGDMTQFTGLLVAYIILALGCLLRSL